MLNFRWVVLGEMMFGGKFTVMETHSQKHLIETSMGILPKNELNSMLGGDSPGRLQRSLPRVHLTSLRSLDFR